MHESVGDSKASNAETGGSIPQSENNTPDESNHVAIDALKSGELAGGAGASKVDDTPLQQTQSEGNNNNNSSSSSSSSSNAAPSMTTTDLKANDLATELTPVEVGRRDVKIWMGSINMEEYIERFFENGWETPAALQEMKEKDLSELGVKSGHKALIMKNIRARHGVSVALWHHVDFPLWSLSVLSLLEVYCS